MQRVSRATGPVLGAERPAGRLKSQRTMMCTITMLGQERVSVKGWDPSIPSVEDCCAVVKLASIVLSGDAPAGDI